MDPVAAKYLIGFHAVGNGCGETTRMFSDTSDHMRALMSEAMGGVSVGEE